MGGGIQRKPMLSRGTVERIVAWLVGLAVVVAALTVVYAGTPHEADPAKLAAVDGDPEVVREATPHGYVLRDVAPDGERVGLVFYPGGRVDPEAYAWTLAPLVERTDVRVYVLEVPLTFSVLDPGAADRVVGSGADVDAWYVGGHSLGGATACRYAAGNPGRVRGVVLLAAYCPDDLGGSDLDALVVTGSRDGVLDRAAFADNRGNLPADARVVELTGVNHSQFGAYGGQRGDRPAERSDVEARRATTRVLATWFENRSGTAS